MSADDWIDDLPPAERDKRMAWRISVETASAYPRILATYGQSYAAGWVAARRHIAEKLEATT